MIRYINGEPSRVDLLQIEQELAVDHFRISFSLNAETDNMPIEYEIILHDVKDISWIPMELLWCLFSSFIPRTIT